MTEGKIFLKPIFSKLKELDGKKEIYYMAKVYNYADTFKKYGLGRLSFGHPGWSQNGTPYLFSKEDIDHLPKYLRRGGEYGHDAVKVNGKLGKYFRNICKLHKIEIKD
jgi:hypothetical protein